MKVRRCSQRSCACAHMASMWCSSRADDGRENESAALLLGAHISVSRILYMQASEEREAAKEDPSPDQHAGPHCELADSMAFGDHLPATVQDERFSVQEAASAAPGTDGPTTPMQRLSSLRRSGTSQCQSSVTPSGAASSPALAAPVQSTFQRVASVRSHASQPRAALPRSMSLQLPSARTHPLVELQRTLSAPTQTSDAQPRRRGGSVAAVAISSGALLSLEGEKQPQLGAGDPPPALQRRGERCSGLQRRGLRGPRVRHPKFGGEMLLRSHVPASQPCPCTLTGTHLGLKVRHKQQRRKYGHMARHGGGTQRLQHRHALLVRMNPVHTAIALQQL